MTLLPLSDADIIYGSSPTTLVAFSPRADNEWWANGQGGKELEARAKQTVASIVYLRQVYHPHHV